MSFRDIKGHDAPIKLLKASLRQGRLPSSYLFIGPEGVGKCLIAKTLAKAVNCLNSNQADCCDTCISCLKIENSSHPDVHWIPPFDKEEALQEASEAIKIEYIRQLQDAIILRPYEGRCKVFIIDNAHLLTLEASNAFLKVLEEPPANSLIILITSKPQLLLPTIISRCQKARFFPLHKKSLEQMLYDEYKVDRVLSHYLAYYCEGRIGRAVRLKGTDILGEKNRIIDYFFTYGGSALNREFAPKDKIKESLDMLVAWLRDIYYLKVGMPHMELVNLDRKTDLLRVMGRYSFEDLDSLFKLIFDTALYLEQNINPRLLLSNLRIRLRV